MATRRRTTPRRRTTRRRRQTTPFVLSARFLREAVALVLVLLAIVSVIALFAPDAGAIVRPWHDVLSTLLGWGIAFAAPLLAGFALIVPVFTFPFQPLSSLMARRQEFEADAFAASHASAADLVSALAKLYRDNASTLTPDPLHSLVYDSHPPATLRIDHLRRGREALP